MRIEVPRTIKVTGETLEVDGFYWKRNVYISQKSIEALAIPAQNTETGQHSSDSFTGYSKIDLNRGIKESPRYIWDGEANILRIIRPKVLLNGMELSKSACWNREKGFMVDLKAVALALGARFSWDNVSKAFICKGIMVAGEPRDGSFWIAPEQLTQIWQDIQYRLKTDNLTLELWTR